VAPVAATADRIHDFAIKETRKREVRRARAGGGRLFAGGRLASRRPASWGASSAGIPPLQVGGGRPRGGVAECDGLRRDQPADGRACGWPGLRIVGHDDEAGKGDHRHDGGRGEACEFRGSDRLRADFEPDVERERRR
jgi:hypothetical protein